MDERLKKQMEFSLEIDKEKNIFRQTSLSNNGRKENDAEHAWHMAVMAYILKEYASEKIDIAKVMIMCLIHDIVEIEAGDTYCYDEVNLKTQKQREDAAKEKIYSLLPEDQKKELITLFDEFESLSTPEARFAKTMDNLQPIMLNDSNNGVNWRERQIKEEQVRKRQETGREGSKILYEEVIEKIIQKNKEKGNLL